MAFVDSRRRPSLSPTWFRPMTSRGDMCLYDTLAIVCNLCVLLTTVVGYTERLVESAEAARSKRCDTPPSLASQEPGTGPQLLQPERRFRYAH